MLTEFDLILLTNKNRFKLEIDLSLNTLYVEIWLKSSLVWMYDKMWKDILMINRNFDKKKMESDAACTRASELDIIASEIYSNPSYKCANIRMSDICPPSTESIHLCMYISIHIALISTSRTPIAFTFPVFRMNDVGSRSFPRYC